MSTVTEPAQGSARGAIPDTIAVIGAGTMGAGIAQLAAQAGAHTLLYDAVPAGLERGVGLIESGLAKSVTRGRLSESDAAAALARLTPVRALSDLAEAGMVIEAAPERLELKLEIFGALAEIVAADCVLATNTSSLSVTEIAAGVAHPERVVGLHFFNPAPVMKLVEVVAGEASGEAALVVARAVGVAMGKRVVDAADIAGFLVNRCNRPYSLEALRLLEERVASVEQIDRITRLGGGFRMGPFELMDLIGIETNHAVAESLYRASFGEPRYQPSYLQARLVAAGRLGRKTGSGWYEYGETPGPGGAPAAGSAQVGDSAAAAADRSSAAESPGAGRVLVIDTELPVLAGLAARAEAAGFVVRASAAAGGAEPEPWLTLSAGEPEAGGGAGGSDAARARAGGAGPRARLLWDGSLHALDPHAAGFHLLAPVASAQLIEVTSTALSDPVAVERLAELAAALGLATEPVADAPGLVLGRIVAQLINEAAFLIGAGNGTPEDVDAGLELGVNHPRGPVAWSRQLSLRHVVGLLDALQRERGEPRYRVAPLLRRLDAVGGQL
jgi:3-hydroxybutyryl-CoA dehydrogenase